MCVFIVFVSVCVVHWALGDVCSISTCVVISWLDLLTYAYSCKLLHSTQSKKTVSVFVIQMNKTLMSYILLP